MRKKETSRMSTVATGTRLHVVGVGYLPGHLFSEFAGCGCAWVPDPPVDLFLASNGFMGPEALWRFCFMDYY